MAGYDVNSDMEISCAVRYEGYGSSGEEAKGSLSYHEYNCYIVEEVRRSIDEDGELGWKLILAGDSKKESYFVSEDNIKLYSTKSAEDWAKENINVYKQDAKEFTNIIKSGDIIRFKTNLAGDIVYVEKMFDFEEHKNKLVEVPIAGGQIYGFANVKKVTGSNVIYDYDVEDTDFIFKKRSVYTAVPLYHVGTGKVELVDISAVPGADSGNNVKVFMRYYNYGVIYDHIFYIYD